MLLLDFLVKCDINNEKVLCEELFSGWSWLFLGFITVGISVYIGLFFVSKWLFKKHGYEEHFSYSIKIEGISAILYLLFFLLFYYFSFVSENVSVGILFFPLAILTILGSAAYLYLYWRRVLKTQNRVKEDLLTKILKFFYFNKFFMIMFIIASILIIISIISIAASFFLEV